MALTDEQLAQAYVDHGDQVAFRRLVERHQERIYGYLLGMVRDRDVANDLFQETYLRVVGALRNERASYTTQGRWLAWVMRIARNAALDYLRSRKKWKDVDPVGSDDNDSYWDGLPDDGMLADELLLSSEQSRLLQEAIDKLPPEQREVLLLRQDADLTFREIAEMTDCSINTALGRMRYALINLRKSMVGQKQTVVASEI